MRFLDTGTSRLFVMLAALILVSSGLWANAYLGKSDEADTAQAGQQDAEATTKKVTVSASDLANTVLDACKGRDDDAKALRAAGLCGDAADTKADVQDAAAQPIEGAQGRQGDQGTQGGVGPRGPGPSVGQVLAAIATYCSANDDCRGPSGTNGKSGATGPSGTDGGPGPKGDAGTDGTNGADGTDGADGRGISSITCSTITPLTSLTITYTDGSTQTVDCS